ncbi:MAG TPA: GNAT family N-acetyltransferase [Polyangiaceae bacterium]|nr:GNAT family N-acetyltransferase [Polyangiaceae bacterium]
MALDFCIRAARPGDEQGIFALIQGLAEYERLSELVTGDAVRLARHLFGPRPAAEALVVEASVESGQQLVAFALFFGNYSTFLTEPGLYLEDIFVLPAYRRRGIGQALLGRVAQVASERQCARLEWSVLDWNANAIAFYERVGAKVLPDWRTCRVTAESLAALAKLR